jgi:hypothetical protein
MDTDAGRTVAAVLRRLRADPALLLASWNWKSALISALARTVVFAAATRHPAPLSSGAEFVLAVSIAGLGGAVAQAFRCARPRPLAVAISVPGPPLVYHFAEFALHMLLGTPHLAAGLGASIGFSCIASSFTFHAVVEGAMLTGSERTSLVSDLRRLPALIASFLLVPVRLLRSLRGNAAPFLKTFFQRNVS